jgi:hypothetical protein
VVIPAVSALILLGLGAFLAVSNWQQSPGFAWSALNGRFLTLVPATVVATGIAVSAWAKWGRHSRYFTAGGSIIGDIPDATPDRFSPADAALAAE